MSRGERALLAAVVLAATLGLAWTGLLRDADNLFYDLHQRHWRHTAAHDIVLVKIDDKAIDALGPWPWPRSTHARLIDRLSEWGAAAVAFDVLFAGPDPRGIGEDATLSDALRRYGHGVLAVAPAPGSTDGALQELRPPPLLARAADRLGHTDLEVDQDGLIRSVYLQAGLGRPMLAQLALALLETTGSAPDAVPGERRPRPRIPAPGAWVRDHRILIPFSGPPGTYTGFSYIDVLDGRAPRERFSGALVLVGVTAVGLAKELSTPVSDRHRLMSGIEIHANIADALRSGRTLTTLPRQWTLLLSLGLVALALLLNDTLSARGALLATLACGLGTLALSVFLLRWHALWFPPAAAFLGVFLPYPLWTWRRLEGARRSLAGERNRLKVTLDSVGDGVVVIGRDQQIQFINPVAEILTGMSLDEARNRPWDEVVHLVDTSPHRRGVHPILRCLRERTTIPLGEQTSIVARDGTRRAVHALVTPLRDGDKAPRGCVLTLTDVTELRHLADQMGHQATHDDLTGLPNRTLLRDRLQKAIERARRADTLVAVLFLDLDDFKRVNDALGHSVGDTLLLQAADRLRMRCRRQDTLARLGGDEFVLVLEGLREAEQAGTVARQLLDALRRPMQIGTHEFLVTGSVGIALYPKDARDVESLLRLADAAMYQAKEAGRNTFRYASEDLDTRALERLSLEAELRGALSDGQLHLYYQPVVELETGRVISAEALMRWEHPRYGLLPPARFVGLAEETGLITTLGHWALRESCRQLRDWDTKSLPLPRVALNISPCQFSGPGLADAVHSALNESALHADRLELELTESMVMNDVSRALAVIGELKALGVHLAIDDFGTGYSSLSYLKQFPLDHLKIDRSFVTDLDADPESQAIVEAIIAMAHGLGMRVIAEGVESWEQFLFLKQVGCDAAQGYLIGSPVRSEEFEAVWHEGFALPA